MPKLPSHGAICPRRVMNLDPSRDRCKIAELNQAKLHRVAFCVDVEIAGVSHRDTDEDAPPTCQLRQPLPESNRSKSKKAEARAEAKADPKAVAQCKENEEAEALKNPQAAVAEKEVPALVAASTPAPATAPATAPASAPASVQGDTTTQDAQSTPAPVPAPTPADSDPCRVQA